MARKTVSVSRLLRKYIPGTSSIKVELGERIALKETLHRAFDTMRYIQMREQTHFASEIEERYICSFGVNFPHEYFSDGFILKLDEEERLILEYKGKERTVSSLDEVVALARACQEEAETRRTVTSQRKKVRELKSKAIIAQVTKLAREERFAFYVEDGPIKFRLYIWLDNGENLMVSIPLSKFQETVPLIRTAILTLRELHQKDIRFRLSEKPPNGWHRETQWITPEPLDEGDEL